MTINYPYAIFSDSHFHEWDFGSYTTTDGVNSRLQNIMDEVKRMCSLLESKGGKDIIFCGDMFHTRGSISPKVINPVFEMFKELCGKGFEFYCIPGNHDLTDENTTAIGNAMHTLSGIDGFYVYEMPTLVGNHLFIPWHEDKLDVLYLITLYSHVKDLNVICHVGLSDVVAGISNTLNPKHLIGENIKNVFVGHFHQHKRFDYTVNGTQRSVFSVGALTHQSFKDVDSLSGFLIAEDENTIVHYESEAPKFVDFVYDDLGEDDLSKFRNSYVRVKLADQLPLITSEEITSLKIALETTGALRVINRTPVSESFTSLKEASNPGVFVFGRKNKLSDTVVEYMKAKYDNVIASKMINIFLKEEILDE